jgi:hypothetical protein
MSEGSITERLAEPFAADEVKWKPGATAGNRALAMCYVDARCVMERLDDVLGVDGWQDEYDFLPDGSCMCRLSLRINGEWIRKTDVGAESEQKDEGDRRKAAVSDALKRTAVKFGVGRYLYSLEAQWVDYDPQKKKFTRTPVLPDWARKGKAAPRPAELQAPAPPPEPEHDPAEVIGAEQVAELEALLTAKNKRWDDARKWLQDTFVRELEPQAQTADLCWKHYLALRDVLLTASRKKKVG